MNWLPLLEYSYRNKISLSTIRRRIKAQGIEHKMEGGRYYLQSPSPEESAEFQNNDSGFQNDINIVIQELKKAYGLVLAEKEDLIAHLKEEIATQKKIIEFLENQINFSEQQRLKSENSISNINSNPNF